VTITVTEEGSATNGISPGQTLTLAGDFTPEANSKLYVWAVAENNNHTNAKSWDISNTGGLSFSVAENPPNRAWAGDANFGVEAVLWVADVGGSPSAMNVTVDPYAGAAHTALISMEVFCVGSNGTLAVEQTKSASEQDGGGGSETIAVTMDTALVSGHTVVCVIAASNDADGAFTVPTGFSNTLVNQSTRTTHVCAVHDTDISGTTITCSDLGEMVGASAIAVLEFSDSGAPAPPVVEGTAESSTNTAGTSHVITLPAGITADDYVLILVNVGSVAGTFDALTDWTESLDENLANGLKILRFTGTGVPSNPTFTSSASIRTASIAFRISGADRSVPPDLSGTATTIGSVNPNPPAVTPSGGTLDYLFIAFCGGTGEEADDDTWANTPPTNYSPSPPLQKACGTAGTNLGGKLAAAYRQLTTGSAEDPGTFNVDVSATWRVHTICIHPAAASGDATVDAVAKVGVATSAGGATPDITAGARAAVGIASRSTVTPEPSAAARAIVGIRTTSDARMELSVGAVSVVGILARAGALYEPGLGTARAYVGAATIAGGARPEPNASARALLGAVTSSGGARPDITPEARVAVGLLATASPTTTITAATQALVGILARALVQTADMTVSAVVSVGIVTRAAATATLPTVAHAPVGIASRASGALFEPSVAMARAYLGAVTRSSVVPEPNAVARALVGLAARSSPTVDAIATARSLVGLAARGVPTVTITAAAAARAGIATYSVPTVITTTTGRLFVGIVTYGLGTSGTVVVVLPPTWTDWAEPSPTAYTEPSPSEYTEAAPSRYTEPRDTNFIEA
jgi:hypothetical protein